TGGERAPGGGSPTGAGGGRCGERLPNPYSEDANVEMTHWFHVSCAAFKRPEPFLAALEGTGQPVPAFGPRAVLEREARLGLEHRRLSRVDAISRAPSSRATCRACKEKIE